MKRADFIEHWLQALESGEYKQTKDKIWNRNDENPKYCCLGVACKVAEDLGVRKVEFSDVDDWNELLPNSLASFMGMQTDGSLENSIYYRGNGYDTLTELNDAGIKFKTIARLIREQLVNKNFEKPRR